MRAVVRASCASKLRRTSPGLASRQAAMLCRARDQRMKGLSGMIFSATSSMPFAVMIERMFSPCLIHRCACMSANRAAGCADSRAGNANDRPKPAPAFRNSRLSIAFPS
jgi:hypothetical protein